MIQKIRNFIRSWPGFGGIPFPVDLLGPMPGCGAVMPQGEEILRTLEDIRGRLGFRKRLRIHVLLSEGLDPAADGWQPHEKLLSFARWAAAHVPDLGPDTRLSTKGPVLMSRGDQGPGRYRLELAFEFTEFIEEEHDDV